MATTEELVKKIELLPSDKQEQVIRYIRFLLTEVENQQSLKTKKRNTKDNNAKTL